MIEKDGSVSDVKVARSVDPSLDKEAIRVVKAMPKWKPGKQRGKAVRVKYTVTCNFQITVIKYFNILIKRLPLKSSLFF